METAVSRVAAYIESRKTFSARRGESIDTIPGYDRVHQLTLADLIALVGIIAEGCVDHATCACCGAVSCETCGVGSTLTDCLPPHCEGSDCWCGPCRDELAREFAAEQRADTAATDSARCL